MDGGQAVGGDVKEGGGEVRVGDVEGEDLAGGESGESVGVEVDSAGLFLGEGLGVGGIGRRWGRGRWSWC